MTRCEHIFQPVKREAFYRHRPQMACQFCGATPDAASFSGIIPGPSTINLCGAVPMEHADRQGPKSRLQTAVEAGQALGKRALYFGCWDTPGHYLHKPDGLSARPGRDFPWTEGLMDGGLLENGKHADNPDGRVYWTAGGLAFWYAFLWWDRSGDRRGASNSGIYVRGFGWPEPQAAFDYGLAAFPHIAARQKHPLVLQDVSRFADTSDRQDRTRDDPNPNPQTINGRLA